MLLQPTVFQPDQIIPLKGESDDWERGYDPWLWQAGRLISLLGKNFMSQLCSEADWTEERLIHALTYGYKDLVINEWREINGKQRLIWEPQYPLDAVLNKIRQRWLTGVIPHRTMHGYCRGRNRFSCTKVHLEAQTLIAFDLVDAFNTPKWNDAQHTLRWSMPRETTLPIKWARRAELWRLWLSPNYCFPQGFCTSPVLFNLALSRAAENVYLWAFKHGWALSIYADNFFLSTRDRQVDTYKTIGVIKKIIEMAGWAINDTKTRPYDMHQNGSLPMLGLVIHPDGTIRLSNKRLRQTRRRLWSLVESNEIDRALGLFESVRQIYGNDIPKLLHPPLEHLHLT